MSTAAVSRADRSGAVLADLLPRAATASRARLRDAALAAGGAAFIGIAAQIAVPVPGSPVPATGQTFAVLLVGTSLGAGRGFLSLALYVLAGMAGAPVFADGVGSSNFGYVLGMLLAATVVGSLARRGGDRGALRTAGTMAVGSLVIYAVGVPYLAVVANLSLAEAVAVGVVPFLIGDSLKALLAMGVLPAAWRLAGRRD
jgi:biotin transport system substrate-specific component